MITETISAREAAGLIATGEAVLVDIREADERARSHVPGSAHAPVSGLPGAAGGRWDRCAEYCRREDRGR